MIRRISDIDIKKINTTILNEVLKNKIHGTGIQVKDDKIYCFIDMRIAFIIDDADFIIDKSKLPTFQIDRLFNLDNTTEVFKSENKKEIIQGKKTISILEFECQDFTIYINEKLYKFLGKTPYKFYAKSPKSPLICTLDNEMKALICPINFR